MLAIDSTTRIAATASNAIFAVGAAAFALTAVGDLATHFALVDFPERPVHVALVLSMAVVALALCIRGSLTSHAHRKKEDGYAHR